MGGLGLRPAGGLPRVRTIDRYQGKPLLAGKGGRAACRPSIIFRKPPLMSETPVQTAAAPKGYFASRVLSVHHWTEKLFSFKVERDPSFRFEAGQFIMIGLMVDGKPLVRAYSMASTPFDEHLEFFSIKVPDGR